MSGSFLVGFVGLGSMGQPMVGQLSSHGVALAAYDTDAEKRQAVAQLPGVTAAGSLADLADAVVAVCMLPNSAIVEEVVAGAGGLVEVLRPGSLIVDMGSSVPRRTVELARTVSAAGLELVDAPVSGGVRQAAVGQLTVMFGGTDEQLDRCRPVLEAVGSRIVKTGGIGTAHAMKALNNVMSAAGLSLACEVVEVGRRFGLEPEVMLEILNSSTGRNHATETKIAQYVLSGSYDSGFLLRLMLKDIQIAVDLAHEIGAEIPLGETCLALWQQAAEVLPADADQTRIASLPALLQAEREAPGSSPGSQPNHSA